MKKAVIGIGTNIGNRQENIKTAVSALELIPQVKVLRQASVYETAPWGYTEQRAFYNTVIEIESPYSAESVLGICLGIEAGMGRERGIKNGPRIIDLDLLVYEECCLSTEELTIPHKLIGERDFVLIPLKELYEDMNVLGFSYAKSYENILEKNTAKKIEKN